MHPAPHNSGHSASPWHIRLWNGLVRISQRRALREMLDLRSDRLLADIGFSRAQLADQIEAAVDAIHESRRVERQVRRELSAYSDRELNDIGIGRCDIRRLAREQAAQVLEAKRLGRFGADPVLQSNTNDNAGRRRYPIETAA